MNKLTKVIITIFVILAIIIGVGYYLIKPEKNMNVSTNYKMVTTEELLRGSFIDNFELEKNPLRLKGQLSVSNEEFRDIIYTIMSKHNIDNLKYTDIKIKDDVIHAIGPYKVFGVIDSNYEVELIPKIKNNNLTITLTNFKIGKIKIKDSMLAKAMTSYKDKLPFEVNDNIITIDKSYTEPLTLNDIKIKENNIILQVGVKVHNILDFIKKYNIQLSI
ncbi:DUF2140 domain-containing protein [Romboutsia maritimum]|uniref:DUF2140 domain-containing protein n=1 Tax=Romboutsia maritimum TaxID=2020948 RepID=A0A371IQB9_9FIRM|nr:DUF2140 domain-containing protein [Romboutsia maritimum]RDY22680.1 DUF2140 domain-containing protein [Romboutsia maritimum]